MWDKVQILVMLSRKKLSKDTIFVGKRGVTLNSLVHLLKKGHNGHNKRKRY